MREITIATTKDKFKLGEKVIAFNWFEKYSPYNFGTYIQKFSIEDKLHEDENCRKIDKRDIRFYNIGEYKVIGILPGIAKIVPWDRQDKETK